METTYTVVSGRDGWQVEVYDGIAVELAQAIADRLGAGIDYIQACDLAEILERCGKGGLATAEDLG
jgi:hypothetical protein